MKIVRNKKPKPFGKVGFKYAGLALSEELAKGLSAEVAALLDSRGLPPSSRPDEQAPDLPEDLSEYDNNGLQVLLGQFRRWEAYASDDLAMGSALLAETEDVLRRWGSHLVRSVKGNAQQKAEIKDTDKKFQQLKNRWVKQNALVLMLGSRKERFEKFASVVSRYITIRTNTRE